MAALSDEIDTLKFVHTYGAGLHSGDADPDVHDPRWQRRQVDDFVEFTVLAEELGFDGMTITEHHAPLMTCPSPHLLLAAAAVKTSRIRLGTAVTVLPLYSPLRVAEEAGTLDLLSGGRFELGLGRGIPGEAQIAAGRNPSDNDLKRAWLEGLEVVNMALTERDFTFDGQFYPVERPTTIATRPLQDRLPVWLGGSSKETMRLAAVRGWNVMRNFGSDAEFHVDENAPQAGAACHRGLRHPPPGRQRSPAGHGVHRRAPPARRDLLPRGGPPVRPRGDPGPEGRQRPGSMKKLSRNSPVGS